MSKKEKNVGKQNKTRLICFRIIALTVFWLLVFVSINPLSAENIDSRGNFYTYFGSDSAGTVPELRRGTIITQPLVIPDNNWKGLEIRFATYARTNYCRILVSVRDESGNAVLKKNINASILEDNQYYHFDIPVQEKSKGKQYEIQIKGINGMPGNSPTIWQKNPDGLDGVIINGTQSDSILDMQVICARRFVYPTVFIAIVALSYIFAVLANQLNERTYLCLCLLLGILFIVINPFQHPLDENTHYIKSMAISRFTPHETVVDGNIGFMLPSSVDDVHDFNLNRHLEYLSEPYDSPIEFYGNAYTTSIIPINHIAASIGLLLARLLHMSIGLTVWMGRLSNYLFYVIVCYFAIKSTKYYKSLFFIIAALPAALWIAASYSTDPVLLSTSLLFVSICLKYRFSDEKRMITRKDLLALIGCSISIMSVKYFIYLAIVTTFFLIPKECFKNKQRRNMLIAFSAIVVVLAIWQYRLLKEFPINEDRTGGTDFGGQIAFVFGHIGYTVSTFTNWFMRNIVGHLQSTTYNSLYPSIGGLLGTACFLSSMIATDKYPAERIKKIHLLRLYFVAVFLFVSLLIMASLYAGYTPVGADNIAGLQPRYFQPVFIFLMLPLAMTRIENHNEYYEVSIVMMMEFYLLISMLSLLMSVM